MKFAIFVMTVSEFGIELALTSLNVYSLFFKKNILILVLLVYFLYFKSTFVIYLETLIMVKTTKSH